MGTSGEVELLGDGCGPGSEGVPTAHGLPLPDFLQGTTLVVEALWCHYPRSDSGVECDPLAPGR